MQHLFVDFVSIRTVWAFYAAALDGPVSFQLALRQYLLTWWTSTLGISVQGCIWIVAQGIILWTIWCMYASVVFGNEHWSLPSLHELIRREIYHWSCAQSGTKHASIDQHLISLGLLPHLLSRRIPIVSWLAPHSRQFKLNIDAALGSFSAAGGGVLRDAYGHFSGAIVFYFPVTSPFHAEL